VVVTSQTKTIWQLREFKTDINTKGEAVFVADSVKSNPLAELFAKQGDLDSNALKDCFAFLEFGVRVLSLKT
jgi:hypothetical protein